MVPDKKLKRLHVEKTQNLTPTESFYAQPTDANIREWHFTLRGAPDTPFAGGLYHGRLMLPENYPLSAPDIYMMTPSGRYSPETKICLNATSYHQESWTPAFTIRVLLTGFAAFFCTNGDGEIASMTKTETERKKMAAESLDWRCPQCGPMKEIQDKVWEGKEFK